MRLRLRALPVVGLLSALLSLGAAPSIASAAEKVHTVQKGQTLGRIAKRYNVTVDVLREVNDLKRGQMIRPGLVLVIPEKGKETEAAKKAASLRGGKLSEPAKKGDKKGDKKDEKKEKGSKADAAKGKARGEGAKEQETVGKGDKFARKPKRPGFVRIVRGPERLETQLLTRHGRLVPSALPGLSRMLRFAPSGAKIPIEPRLATLLGLVSDHFGGKPIHVVSGFRPYSPTQYTRHSKHNVGHAVDFTVEGVPNTVLRDFCRTFRNAGVGYYPNSTFVHLDVRTTKTYWVDYSRPGDPPRYRSAPAPHHPHAAPEEEAASEVDSSEAHLGDESKDTQGGGSQPSDTSTGNQGTQDSATPGEK